MLTPYGVIVYTHTFICMYDVCMYVYLYILAYVLGEV